MKFLFLMSLILSLNVFAESKKKPAEPVKEDACASDIELHCPSLKGKTGFERIHCLGKQYAGLNKKCKTALDEETKNNPCLIPTIRLCPKNMKEPTSNKNLFCLDQKIADVPEACKKIVEARPKAKDIKAEFDNACEEDLKTLCKGLEGDASNMCLEKNFKSNKVSSECSKVLTKYQRR